MALDPVRAYIRGPGLDFQPSSPEGVNRLVEGWARVLYDFDEYSMKRFLQEEARLTSDQIDAIGTLENLTSRLPLSFLHSFLGRADINPNVQFWELEGGSWRLPYALLDRIQAKGVTVHMNARVTDVWWSRAGEVAPLKAHAAHLPHPPTAERARLKGATAVLRCVTEEGGEDITDFAGDGAPETPVKWFRGDMVILTIPFSATRFVRFHPQLSYGKRRAINELHYDAATKVLLEFSQRWWEFTSQDWEQALNELEEGLPGLGDNKKRRMKHLIRLAREETRTMAEDNFAGGGNVSDNPNRFLYFPSHRVAGSAGGVALASYTWADDARRWDSNSPNDRYQNALRGLMEVHGQRIALFYTGHGATQSWMQNRYALGEAAVFAPGQFTELHPHIPGAEGNLHFAGEHTSLKHAWIEGAIESAVRVALEVNGE